MPERFLSAGRASGESPDELPPPHLAHAVASHEEENLPPVKSQPSIINPTAQIFPELVKPDRFHATLNAVYK